MGKNDIGIRIGYQGSMNVPLLHAMPLKLMNRIESAPCAC